MNNDNGGSAFPVRGAHGDMQGMSLRDYFAAQMLCSVFGAHTRSMPDINAIASAVYKIADAMLAELNKQ